MSTTKKTPDVRTGQVRRSRHPDSPRHTIRVQRKETGGLWAIEVQTPNGWVPDSRWRPSASIAKLWPLVEEPRSIWRWKDAQGNAANVSDAGVLHSHGDLEEVVGALAAALADAEVELEGLRGRVEFLSERERHIAKVLDVADSGQYRNDWDGAIARLKAAAHDAALEEAAKQAQSEFDHGDESDRVRDVFANVVAAIRALKEKKP